MAYQLDQNSVGGSTTSFTDNYVYTPISLPSGRAALNGIGYALITALRAYVAGRSGARTVSLYLDGVGGTGAFGVGSAGSAADTGFVGCSLLVAGGTANFFIDANPNGSFYFGRAPGSSGATDSYGTTWGPLFASMLWAQVPSAPLTPAVTPGSTTALVSWAAPSDNGGTAITGYRIDYSTSPTFSSYSSKTVGVVTSDTITGLTPGTQYYFRVCALNAVTSAAGVPGPASSSVGGFTGTVPGAPTAPAAVAGPGRLTVGWTAPASDGGVAIDAYRLEVATDSGFTSIVATVDVGAAVRSKTVLELTPGTTYYARVRAHNSVGYGANSTTASTTLPARTVLDTVQGAALHLSDGTQVEIRSDAANAPTLALGYVAFGTGTAFTSIATVPTNAGAGTFFAPGGARNLALVSDPAGNLYVIGADDADTSKVLAMRYERTATTTWALDGTLGQGLTNTGDPLVAFAATYVPGSGVSPTPTILVLARRAGTVGAGALSFATLNLTNLEASAGALFIASGSDPSWLSTPPVAGTPDTGVVDVAPLVDGGTRIAVLGNGFAMVDVTNGVVAGVTKAAAGTATPGPWARIIGVNATTLAVLTVSGGALAWAFYGTTGSLLGSGTYAGANAFGGAFSSQWDAYYDRVAQVVTVYYVADNAGARQLESIDISASTYAAAAAVTLTAALGAASTTNSDVRVPERTVDERRVLVAAANIVTATSVKSVAAYVDTSGNAAPNAPALTDIAGFDASQSYTLPWAFSDNNPADTQTAYELQIQRVSDSVNVVSTGKVVSTALNRIIAAATLVNGVAYRWRVRTYDALDTAGAWSAYDAFTTAATGTLTITSPAADDPAGVDTATIALAWSYVQADGYVQTQRRIRVLNATSGAVLSDTTMQASVATSATVAVPTDVRVRIELSIITNAPGTPTITANRYLTSSYSSPMQPSAIITATESYLNIVVVNPPPTGSKPEVVTNIIERRLAGTADAFIPVAIVGHNGEYNDHAVRSATAYDYRVRGVTA